MTSPFPFTAGQILSAAELNSMGETETYTPTWTNYTRGNGTSVGYRGLLGKWAYVYAKETLGSTSSVTGALRLTLPYTPSRIQGIPFGVCQFGDIGAAAFVANIQPISATAVELRSTTANGTYTQQQSTSSTLPFTWTTNDYFEIAMFYEAE